VRYLIIDKDYCVFQANLITDAARSHLKAGELAIIDTLNSMKGMAMNGVDWEPVQVWCDEMIDAPLEERK
jgi:hypothetical protein